MPIHLAAARGSLFLYFFSAFTETNTSFSRIGRWGMGVVFMPEQHEPVRRRVPLKIIKPDMDTRQEVSRFEAERRALSLMDHPNIEESLRW